MTIKQNHKKPLVRLTRLALVIGLTLPAMASHAFNFELMEGEVTGSLNTTVSANVAVSTANPNSDLMAPTDGNGSGASQTADDHRKNFEKGDVTTNEYKVFSELNLEYQNYYLKVSGKAWYDHWLETKNGRYKDFDDSGFDDLAKFQGIELMDAYVGAMYDIGEMPLDVRVGKQVVGWGEGTFFPGGIMVNPIDVSTFNIPGSKLDDAFIPTEMIYGSLGLTDTVTLEAYYQLKWRPSNLNGCGTFYSNVDIIQPGCGPVYLMSTVPEEDQISNPGIPVGYRASDNTPRDSGQWGVSVKYFAEWLNSTEFGFYAMNYHDSLPTPMGIYSDPENNEVAEYYAEFAEDIRLYGLSFNTSLESGWSVSGEVAYRPNAPLAFNANQLLEEALSPELTDPSSDKWGTTLKGYERKAITTAQLTLMNMYPQVLGASALVVAGGIGGIHISDLSSENGMRFGRSSAFGSDTKCGDPNDTLTDKFCEDEGYTTSNAWGYRMMAALPYTTIIEGALVTPSVMFRHDVKGYSVGFSERQKAVILGVKSTWQNKYTVATYYTNYFDGGKYSTLDDRDTFAVSVSASF